MKNIRNMKNKISSYIYTKYTILTLLLIFFVTIIGLFNSKYQMDIINLIVNESSQKIIIVVFVIYILINFLNILFNYIYNISKNISIEKIKSKMMNNIISDVFKQSIKNINSHGKYMSWLSNDIENIDGMYLESFFNVISELLYVIIAIILVGKMNLIILILLITSSIVFSFVVKKYSPSIEEKSVILSRSNESFFAKIQNLVNGLSIISFNNKEKYLLEKINKESLLLKNHIINQEKGLNFVYCILNLVAIFFQIGIFVINGYFVYLGIMSIGSLIFIANVSGRLMNSAYVISSSVFSIKSANKIYDKIFQDINSNSFIDDFNKKDICNINNINLKSVSVCYGDKKVLDNFSLLIEKGKKYVIVGESGSGKTTIINTILGLVDKYEGDILINGININEIRKSSLFNNIGFINSDKFIFYNDIRNNILSLSEKTVDIKENKIDKMISELNLNDICLNKQLNENEISTGQIQRINFARLFYDNKKTIILDEATANLDLNNRQIIEDKLFNDKELTLILITHHLDQSLQKRFDYVIDLNEGYEL